MGAAASGPELLRLALEGNVDGTRALLKENPGVATWIDDGGSVT